MKRNIYDTRPLVEVFNEMITMNTDQGDKVVFHIDYNGTRPKLVAEFHSFSKNGGRPVQEDLSDWLPETPFFYRVDGTGERIENMPSGHTNWKDFFYDPLGIFKTLIDIVKCGGRTVEVKENR